MSDIRVDNLRHVYSAGTPFEKTAIEDVNLQIEQGEFIGLIGHTGSGKSTFIQHLNALLKPTSGAIYCNDKDINRDKFSRRDIKWEVGLVFQYPENQLFEENVYKDIAFGPKNMGLDDAEVDRRVRQAAQFAGVEEELFEKSPLELSGGQKRRIAIAGVIAMEPKLLVLDEPTAGLDPAGCRQIMDNILAYREKSGSTIIIVSHNMDDAAKFANRILVFNKGRVVMDGKPEEVFSRASELCEIGLSVPMATQIAMELKAKGMELKGAIYTREQLLNAILEAKGVGRC